MFGTQCPPHRARLLLHFPPHPYGLVVDAALVPHSNKRAWCIMQYAVLKGWFRSTFPGYILVNLSRFMLQDTIIQVNLLQFLWVCICLHQVLMFFLQSQNGWILSHSFKLIVLYLTVVGMCRQYGEVFLMTMRGWLTVILSSTRISPC